MLILITACSDSTLQPTEQSEIQFEKNAAKSNGSVIFQARGSGHVETGGDFRSFSFTAREYSNGTIDGRWQFFNRSSDFQARGKVMCMQKHGDIVYIGGIMNKGPYAGTPNNETGFRVVDNGEGNNDPSDQASLMFVGGGLGFAQSYCEGNFQSPPLVDLKAGNIQVD